MLADLLGTDKQITWAKAIRESLLITLPEAASSEQLAEIKKVSSATWWIDIRKYPIKNETVNELVGAAWLTNNNIGDLPTASVDKLNMALRNGGKIEPLRYAFGTMCAGYTHLLTLKNGNQFVVSESVAKTAL